MLNVQEPSIHHHHHHDHHHRHPHTITSKATTTPQFSPGARACANAFVGIISFNLLKCPEVGLRGMLVHAPEQTLGAPVCEWPHMPTCSAARGSLHLPWRAWREQIGCLPPRNLFLHPAHLYYRPPSYQMPGLNLIQANIFSHFHKTKILFFLSPTPSFTI